MANTSAESNFRSNLSQFRWSRGVTDDSQPLGTEAQSGNSRNPFSRFYNAVGGSYVPLRSNERPNEEEAYFALSRWERFGACVSSSAEFTWLTSCRRLLGFLACLAGAAVCFAVAFLTLPLIALRPAKFALSFRYVYSALPVSPHSSCVCSRVALAVC